MNLSIEINKVFLSNGKINGKRLCNTWIEKNEYGWLISELISQTSFLNQECSLLERIYCLNNNITSKVICPTCLKEIVFNGWKYPKHCSLKCSNSNKDKKLLVEKTNMSKYGTRYPLMCKEIQQKSSKTLIDKYGVDNASKSELIKQKKIKTSLTNFNTNHPLQNENILNKLKSNLIEKYGVDNVQKCHSVLEKRKNTKRINHYNTILNKFSHKVLPLFSENEYKKSGSDFVYLFKCVLCNLEFESSIKNGRIPRCLNCYPFLSGYSNLEKEVVSFINELGINNIQENTKKIIPPLELDIYLPDYNIALEFNGLYWHGEIQSGNDKTYHYNKTYECFKRGIKLIHIFEDEWINKSEIIKSIIKNNINKSNKIYARKCSIKILDNKVAEIFYNENHLQGYIPSKYHIGLYYNDELISSMSFSKPRSIYGNNNKNYEYELIRFCNKISFNVIGGASRLFQFFIKNYNCNSIFTYSDISKSGLDYESNVYYKLGFKYLNISDPNYWYIIDNNREYRYKYQKKNLEKLLPIYNNLLTEWENMQNNNIDRIWDCGNLRFGWIK